jgi:hypothetical protein
MSALRFGAIPRSSPGDGAYTLEDGGELVPD